MQFFAEQHLASAKMVRAKGLHLKGAERERAIKSSNSLVVCARLSARDRGGISLDGFEWNSVSPDWNAVDEQIQGLEPPQIDSPSLIPTLE
jgi:hypothetical protein